MTVLGPIEPDRLGDVLMHEHLLHDQVDDPCWFRPDPSPEVAAIAEAPMAMDILGYLTRSPFGNRDNCRLTRDDPIVDEVLRFKHQGGGTIVEVTSRGLMPDPEGVRAISEATGVHVVMGCGWYVDHVLPDDLLDRPIDDLATEIVADMREGILGTDVRAGIIGEIGTSAEITPREEHSLRAAARAAVETGDAPDRVVMNHMDEANDLDYCRRVLDLGCVIEFDTFGCEWYYDTWGLWEPRDTDRVAQIAALCAEGHADRITLAHDIFYKQSLRAYGGLGYDHLHRSVVPMLLNLGVSEANLTAMFVDAPRRLLTLPTGGGR